MQTSIFNLREVTSDSDYKVAVSLFKEYALSIDIDLDFQNFDKELENLEEKYSRPEGVIYITYNTNDLPVGCFGIRTLENTTCELKRMYLKNEVRNLGLGTIMMKKAIVLAEELGYTKMRLDTLSTMLPAIALYKKFGFYEIESYCYNPIEEAKYFELDFNKVLL